MTRVVENFLASEIPSDSGRIWILGRSREMKAIGKIGEGGFGSVYEVL
jgi:hypothetical protein